ncbi:response regulator transcription factor [Sporolactobacillus terrae]|uniref:DNA-binding response regulator n=1 Tax=Sporolactobacillus terrae TaxID=269673 RepID=A0A410D7W3_9BACL|nr:response regulator transcription factor [Sporolactobacillus terrae]QAA22207.1 DNA-binding response regulator [Sporolactobacillus terrae]QAA25181.1 DNA-binding response regulator [Sporolactobacillus terrae]UAK16999.1 response regulator transcription factor [Sporolactobacillus terrae]BBN98517.1 DNA-binding response regulator [Sporolactobacillus terrae]
MRIVIAEDQGMLRGALVQLLDMEEDFLVVGQTDNGDKALALIEETQPNLVIADIEMPGMSGLDLAEQLKNCKSQCKVVIVTTFARPGYLERAMKANVSGYILKDEPINDLMDHLRLIDKGGKFISPELAASFYFSEENPLTDRECDCLRLVLSGHTTKQISDILFLSQGTVRNYLSTAMQKLNAGLRMEAAKKAQDNGWL